MKFLVSTKKNKSTYIKLLVDLSLYLFLLFLSLHCAQSLLGVSESFETYQNSISEEETATLYEVKDLIRDLHTQIFLFNFLFLFLSSLWIQSDIRNPFKKPVLITVFLITFIHFPLIIIASIFNIQPILILCSTILFYGTWLSWIVTIMRSR